MERGNKLSLVSLALAPLLLSVEAQGVVTGARCNGNTCQNLTGQQVQVTGNEAAKTINILATPGGTGVHSDSGASIGLNGARLGTIDVGRAINKTNRNILWLHNSTLGTFINNGRLTSGLDGQAINVRGNTTSSITNFTNNGTITGSSGVWMQNGSITTLTNNRGATIDSNNAAGRFGAIDLNSNARIDNLINNGSIVNTANTRVQAILFEARSTNAQIGNLTNNAGGTIEGIAVNAGNGNRIGTITNSGRIDNTANANTQALRVQAGASVGTIENQGTGTIVGISTAARGSIDTINNAGTIDRNITNVGSINNLNNNAGSITSIINARGATMGSIANNANGSIDSLNNQAGGTITTFSNNVNAADKM